MTPQIRAMVMLMTTKGIRRGRMLNSDHNPSSNQITTQSSSKKRSIIAFIIHSSLGWAWLLPYAAKVAEFFRCRDNFSHC
jgi:hypothetical protein